MFPTPKPALTPNTYAYESEPLVKATGFREYDARWFLGKEINLMGVQALGLGLGTMIRVLNAGCDVRGGGSYVFVEHFPSRYIADLTKRTKLNRRLKVVCAWGNGTAGAFAPRVLESVGYDVVPLDCELHHTFPKYNPATE